MSCTMTNFISWIQMHLFSLNKSEQMENSFMQSLCVLGWVKGPLYYRNNYGTTDVYNCTYHEIHSD